MTSAWRAIEVSGHLEKRLDFWRAKKRRKAFCFFSPSPMSPWDMGLPPSWVVSGTSVPPASWGWPAPLPVPLVFWEGKGWEQADVLEEAPPDQGFLHLLPLAPNPSQSISRGCFTCNNWFPRQELLIFHCLKLRAPGQRESLSLARSANSIKRFLFLLSASVWL